MWRNDKYVESPIFRLVWDMICAGIVDAVGKDVTGFVVGGRRQYDSSILPE